MACGRCPGGGGGNPPSSSCSGSTCFRATNHTIICADSVGPCGQSDTFDLTTINTAIKGCTDGDGDCPVTYQLLSFTSHFSAVTVSEAGEVSFTTSDSAEANAVGTVRYRIFCTCNSYSATAKLFICIKDLCANEVCGEDEQCDKCTGICEPVVPNAILT